MTGMNVISYIINMKNRYLFIVLLLITYQLAVGQQVPREEVLLELFTGTW